MKSYLKIIFAAFLAVFFTGCLGSTTGAGAVGANRTQLLLVSESTMEQSAVQSYAQVVAQAKQKGALNTDAATTARVRAIAKKLILQSKVFREDALKWDWRVNVITDKTVNAWCMPGGKIVVYTGIINTLALTDAQLAAIMGHEIAHALREHSREQASYDQLRQIGIFAVSQVAGGTAGNLANLASQYTFTLPFSRSHETEADHVGTELMARAGYDPYEAVAVWQKMEKLSATSTPEILSTHPSHETRIKDLTEVAKKVYPLYEKAKKSGK